LRGYFRRKKGTDGLSTGISPSGASFKVHDTNEAPRCKQRKGSFCLHLRGQRNPTTKAKLWRAQPSGALAGSPTRTRYCDSHRAKGRHSRRPPRCLEQPSYCPPRIRRHLPRLVVGLTITSPRRGPPLTLGTRSARVLRHERREGVCRREGREGQAARLAAVRPPAAARRLGSSPASQRPTKDLSLSGDVY
jgi:hypothetical protein